MQTFTKTIFILLIIFSFLQARTYSLKWYSSQIKNQSLKFNQNTTEIETEIDDYLFFDKISGIGELFFIDNTAYLFQLVSKINQISVFLYYTKYSDEKILAFKIKFLHFVDKKNISQEWQILNSTIQLLRGEQKIKREELIQFKITNNKHIEIKLQKFNIELDYKEANIDIPILVFFIILAALIFYTCFKILKNEQDSERLSQITTYHWMIYSFHITNMLTYVGLREYQTVYILLVFISYGFQFLIIKLQFSYLKVGFKSFKILLLPAIYMAILTFGYYLWFDVINLLSLVPQIIFNIKNLTTMKNYNFLFLVSLNALFTIYIRACPENIFQLSNYPKLILICSSLFVLQIIIFFLQEKYGPIFILKKYLYPNYYNYYETVFIDQNSELYDTDCVICLQPLSQEINSQVSPQAMESKEIISFSKVLMKTPCGHRFHCDCLKACLDIKLQCPIDRSVLPPLM